MDPDPQRLRLCRQSFHRLAVVGVSAPLLVKYGGDSLGAPVVEIATHIFGAVFAALDEYRLIADCLLLTANRSDIFMHAFAADLHIADRMVTVGLWITFPRVYAMRHQLTHCRLKIVIANETTGDARRSRRDARFVEYDDIPSGPLTTCLQPLC